MSKWGPSDEERDERFLRARIVDRYHPEADVLDYLRERSRADDGRVVTDV